MKLDAYIGHDVDDLGTQKAAGYSGPTVTYRGAIYQPSSDGWLLAYSDDANRWHPTTRTDDPDMILWNCNGSAYLSPIALDPKGFMRDAADAGTTLLLSSDHPSGRTGWTRLNQHADYIDSNYPGINVVAIGNSHSANYLSMIVNQRSYAGFLGIAGVYNWATMWDNGGVWDTWANTGASNAGWSQATMPTWMSTKWTRSSPDTFLIAHADDDVVHVSQTRDAVDLLRRLGARVWHHEPAGVPVDAHYPDDEFNYDALLDWLDRYRQ